MMRILILLVTCLFFSCGKEEIVDNAPQQLMKDIEIIEAYLATAGLQAESTPSGLHYIIEEEGTGDHPTLSSKVTVNYRGYLTNNLIFDETKPGEPLSFFVGQVIKGWQEGIPLFKKGGKGRLFIPSGLAYGTGSPSPKIPSNSVLIFEIDLVDFE
jgi:FKBP-type peptidyl-prolyl cis-trans isomerase FkpA